MYDTLGSNVPPVSETYIDDIDVSVDPKVRRAVDSVAVWASNPYGRLVITGGYGTGKSHMLKSLAYFFKPVALYISAADFESIVFAGLQGESLLNYMDVISRAPILLLDDLGMEYGSGIVKSQLEHIIDTRWANPDWFPTAIASNMSGNELQTLGRMGSRIMDRDNLVYAGMPGVGDYRLARNSHKS